MSMTEHEVRQIVRSELIPLSGDPWLNINEVALRSKCGVISIIRRLKEGTFPQPSGTKQFRRWRMSTIDEAIAKGL